MMTAQFPKMNRKNRRAQARRATKRLQPGFAGLESLEPRVLLSGTNLNELVDTNLSAVSLASALVGAGVEVSNVTYTGGSTSKASFSFNDPTVVGFGQGIILASGNAADVVGPNLADSTSTDFMLPGDADLDTLSGFTTFDAAVLEFDFVPTSNQVVFYYSFASDEYPEWVNTPYNDVFAFFVNGQNYAVVRQTAGDPNAAFVPVAVNNINNGNELYPEFLPARPDLFRPNYVTADGTPSLIDLELDGITDVLTFQAPVIPGVVNHMKLAIADASDGIYDSAVFIQAGSLVSNDNPIADLSISPSEGPAPLAVTAIIEGEDPNGAPLTYSINWGDGTPDTTGLLTNPTDDEEKTALESHTFTSDGTYYVTLTVSNGSLSSTSIEDVTVGTGGGGGQTDTAPEIDTQPENQSVVEGELFSFFAWATGQPEPDVQWQVSTDGGDTFVDIAGANDATYSGLATLADDGSLFHAVFTNSEGSVTTDDVLLSVSPGGGGDNTAPDAPIVTLANDTGAWADDLVTSDGTLMLSNIEVDALVEYSVDQGQTWSASFAAVEGGNDVLVIQTDAAGNTSLAAGISFTLDTIAPAAPGVALANDTGASLQDKLTRDGNLALSEIEPDALVEYSTDGGTSWADTFTPVEGDNDLLVRQTDAAGNVSGATAFSFTLDTVAPAAPVAALATDSGSSAIDKLTNVGTLTLSEVQPAALVEYSTDNGASWSEAFAAVEGHNALLVRQTDEAGNVSDATAFTFTLDTVGPSVTDPTFSSTDPILVNATGLSLTATATDANGIATQYSGAIVTTTAGLKSVSYTAVDHAGNMTTINVPYVVGYKAINVSPAAGATFKRKSSISVAFQVTDANGLIANTVAQSLASSIRVTFANQAPVTVKYNSKTRTYSAKVTNRQLAGAYSLTIQATINNTVVMSDTRLINIL